MALLSFLGHDMITALGQLQGPQLLGPWTGRQPAQRRAQRPFTPALYGEDHAHPHVELCLLIEGRCLFSFGRKTGLLTTGDLVMCPPLQPHAEAYWRRGDTYRLVWWTLHETDPTLHVTRYSRRQGFVLEHRMSLGALPAEGRERLQRLRAFTAAPTPPPVDAVREALLTLTLALYRRALEPGASGQLDTRAQLLKRAADFVRAHADRPLTLDDVARAVHVSPNYLTSLFRAGTGTSLGRFILEERIGRARQQLREPGATVKHVALTLGFADPFTFSRTFKRITGSAPRTWLARAAD